MRRRWGYGGRVAKTWLSLTVELVEGAGYRFWPRPGRVFAAARSHTFSQLATAIDISFGRWDIAHLWQFELAGNLFVAPADPEWQSGGSENVLERREPSSAGSRRGTSSSTSSISATRGCTSAASADARIDPLEALGDAPPEPTPYYGWGILPDQYLRRFAEDDGEKPVPVDQRNRDLPPLPPLVGPRRGRAAPNQRASRGAAARPLLPGAVAIAGAHDRAPVDRAPPAAARRFSFTTPPGERRAKRPLATCGRRRAR